MVRTKKKKKEPTFYEQVMKLKHAGIYDKVSPNRPVNNLEGFDSINERIAKILDIVNTI